MKLKKWALYWTEWLIPSSTAIYIVLHDFLGVGMLPAYFIGSLSAGIIFYPLNKYIFKKDI